MKKSKHIIIIFILILLFILLCILTMVIIKLKKEENSQIAMNTVSTNITVSDTKPKTIEDILKKHNSEFISQDRNRIYTILAKDLYDENGKSNEDFIIDLVQDLKQFFETSSFYIIDEEKSITIYAKRSSKTDDIDLVINNIENFYKETNGREYSSVDKAEIASASNLLVSNKYLEMLDIHSMYFSYIEKYLTNGRELENGYTVYVDQQIKLKLAPNKVVFNLVFMEDYKDKILYNISLEDKLSEIAEKYDDYAFGGLDKGYLGYRSGNFYYFFYENEASIYSYTYLENTKFEDLLTNYIETKDLNEFTRKLKTTVKSYADIEYDEDIQRLFVSYPTRGIKIDIKDNNPKGITLYSNYHFSDTTKQLVKDGKIQYNKNDYVNEYEQMRKEAE